MKTGSKKAKLEVFVHDCSDEGGTLSSKSDDAANSSKTKQKKTKQGNFHTKDYQTRLTPKRKTKRQSAKAEEFGINDGDVDLTHTTKNKRSPKSSKIIPSEVKKDSNKIHKLKNVDSEDGIDKSKKRRHSDSRKRKLEELHKDISADAKSQCRSKSEERSYGKRNQRRQSSDRSSNSELSEVDFHSSKQCKNIVPSKEPPPSESQKSEHRIARRSSDLLRCNTKNISEDSQTTELRCIKVKRGVVVTLDQQQTISFQGRVMMSVISGEVTMYGHKLNQNSPEAKIVSTSSHSCVTLTTTDVDKSGESVVDGCKKHFLSDKEIETVTSTLKNPATVLLLRKLDDNCCEFVSKIIPFHTLFGKPMKNQNKDTDVNELLKSINVKVFPVHEDTNTPVLKLPEDFFSVGEQWMEIIKQTDNGAKVVTCGGKNSGKSTFNKFLINFSLQRLKRICYLDCDVGQTELNPPGSVALHILEEPLFGPPFSHQKDPYFMCFYGPVSPGDNPSLYSNCVKRVYEEYEKLNPKPPLVVNTMGWNKGLGVNLLVDICHMARPDFVVQLDTMNQANNFQAITHEYISTTPGWIYNRNRKNPKKFSHQLATIESPVTPQVEKQIQFSARDLRDLTTMGYFSRTLKAGETLQMAPVYAVPWRHLGLHTTHVSVPSSEILAAINASIVALCIADISKAWRIDGNPENPLQFKQTPVCQCLGYGIVRAIDMEKGLLYIITPLEESLLTMVNTLMRGSSNIPRQLILKQTCSGQIPYVDTHKSVTGSTSVRPRRYMPRRGREPSQHDYSFTENP